MLDLDPIKARLNAATPGPWKQRDGWKQTIMTTNKTFRYPPDYPSDYPSEHLIPYQDSDGDFIAHAPTDIAALIEEVERVRAENATLKEQLEQVPPSHFFGVGQEWEWGSGRRAVIIGYHPHYRKLKMRTTHELDMGNSIGHEFWYCPITLGR